MDLREQHATQRRHPWEVARFQFLSRVVRDHGLTGQVQTVLDAGAGDAWFARQLVPLLGESSRFTCWDAEYTSEMMAELRSELPPQIALSTTRPPVPHDLVLLLDVLEHVEHDAEFLHALVHESLRPGGWLLFTVPAWQPLFSRHDTWLHHYRRYAPAQATAVLQGAGLRVVESGGLFHSLLLPRLATVALERLSTADKPHEPTIAWRHGGLVTGAVQSALALDNAVSRLAARQGLGVPGLSFWALAQRPA